MRPVSFFATIPDARYPNWPASGFLAARVNDRARAGTAIVLVIHDWAMAPLSETERRDFWEICEDRYQMRSTILKIAVARPRAGTSRLEIRRSLIVSSTDWFKTLVI